MNARQKCKVLKKMLYLAEARNDSLVSKNTILNEKLEKEREQLEKFYIHKKNVRLIRSKRIISEKSAKNIKVNFKIKDNLISDLHEKLKENSEFKIYHNESGQLVESCEIYLIKKENDNA